MTAGRDIIGKTEGETRRNFFRQITDALAITKSPGAEPVGRSMGRPDGATIQEQFAVQRQEALDIGMIEPVGLNPKALRTPEPIFTDEAKAGQANCPTCGRLLMFTGEKLICRYENISYLMNGIDFIAI